MDLSSRVAPPADPKGRLVSIFAGAVLLPSVALSVLSLHSIPKQAEAMKLTMLKDADKVLLYIEKDLELTAKARALDAARVVGLERLLDGRPEVIQLALKESGMGGDVFQSLRLEGSSSRAGMRAALRNGRGELEILHDALLNAEALSKAGNEDSVTLPTDSEVMGRLRFRFSCNYVWGVLLRDYFQKAHYTESWVIRVADPQGQVLYENAPTPLGEFDAHRPMESTSFRGLTLYLRSKERPIAEEIRRWTGVRMVLILFIDLMLGAGLFLVYSNVRREAHLARLKSDFVANVSHELKTPLALVRLFAETLEMGRVPNEAKARQYYRVINKESQRLTQLINNILDFSRIEAGRKEYRFAPADLGQIVNEVLDAYRFQIEQQEFKLELNLAEDLPEVDVDREAMSQALINLVNNALKYSREDKYIRLDMVRRDDRILISVTDHGIGIAKGEQNKIFEKFYRGEDSLVHETKGSGLGLALVKHIMEAHGGSVEVESAPGKGSTFTLVLPCRQKK